MNCKICNQESKKIFNAKVLYKHNVSYFQCVNCGFAQTETPFWLNEAYESSMNISDTGVMFRSERLSKITTSLICLFFNKKGIFLDYAGGLGVFTRQMRDIGFDYYWNDPFTKNELARGFEGGLNQKYEAVTTFESFEHFENHLEELEKILKLTDTIILTTDLISNPAPAHSKWWYYGSEHGQHIAFHSIKSFKTMAKLYNLNYHNAMNVHILTKKKIGFFGTQFLKFKYAKHCLYLGCFLFSPFLKSKAIDDMNSFYVK
jgi:Zn ribbon nucleic-acid-binding protein